MTLFRSYAPFCYRPILMDVKNTENRTCSEKNNDGWKFQTQCVKSCASLWIHLKVMHLFAIGYSQCQAPFKLFDMNTKTHLHTHTHTLDLHAKFQIVAATEWPVELLVTAENSEVIPIFYNNYTMCIFVVVCFFVYLIVRRKRSVVCGSLSHHFALFFSLFTHLK